MARVKKSSLSKYVDEHSQERRVSHHTILEAQGTLPSLSFTTKCASWFAVVNLAMGFQHPTMRIVHSTTRCRPVIGAMIVGAVSCHIA